MLYLQLHMKRMCGLSTGHTEIYDDSDGMSDSDHLVWFYISEILVRTAGISEGLSNPMLKHPALK